MRDETLKIIFRTIITLSVLFVLIRMMGKKQVSQLNIFDYMIGISIGSVAADISLDIEKDYVAGLCSMIIYGLLGFVVSYLCLKNKSLRHFFLGSPTVLISKGKIIDQSLYKAKFNVSDLLVEARNNGYFNLDEIEEAVLEVNGKVSFLSKTKNQPVTIKDMNLAVNPTKVLANLVIDGKLQEDNLAMIKKSKEWFLSRLKQLGYSSLDNIILVTIDNNDKIIVYDKKIYQKQLLTD